MIRSVSLLLMFGLGVVFKGWSQNPVVFEHISNTTIYDYLDEMANLKIIELNSAVKPYSRRFIMNQLDSIAQHSEQLNKRQKGELQFFFKVFSTFSE